MRVVRKRRKYPWDEWADGQVRVATQGEDFDCSAASFVTLLHYTAKTRQTTVETSTDGDKVTFMFHKEVENVQDKLF